MTNKKITADDFLNRMLHDDNNLIESLNDFDIDLIDNNEGNDEVSDSESESSTQSKLPAGTCSFCVTNIINTVFLPCGHTSCSECFTKCKNVHVEKCRTRYEYDIVMFEEKKNKPPCPYCRGEIMNSNTLYI